MISKLRTAATVLLFLSACTPSSDAPPTVAPATTASVPAGASSSAGPTAAVASRLVHYDVVLTTSDGKATGRAALSLDLSDAAPGSAWIAKNVSFPGGSRADVGARVKCRMTMQGDSPRLEVDAEISALDSTGTIRRAATRSAVTTPLGATTSLLDSTDGGMQFHLSATPAALAPLEPKTPDVPGDAYAVDVTVSHTGEGVPSTPTTLVLKLSGDAPAIERLSQTVPLSVGDAGSSVRQDVGTRLKATGHARGSGLEVDFDLEWSALEPATPAARIRKLTAHGQVLAPFDRPTTAFSGEEDGHRYTIVLTPHRVK